MRLLAGFGVFVGEQIRISLMVRAADAAAQLMQLRQAKFVRTIDDDGVGMRVVNAGFDNCGAQQDVVFLLGEFTHHAFQLALR